MTLMKQIETLEHLMNQRDELTPLLLPLVEHLIELHAAIEQLVEFPTGKAVPTLLEAIE